REPGHGHRHQILDLLAVTTVDAEPSRRIIEQLLIYLDELGNSCRACGHRLYRECLGDDQLATRCAGSCRAAREASHTVLPGAVATAPVPGFCVSGNFSRIAWTAAARAGAVSPVIVTRMETSRVIAL